MNFNTERMKMMRVNVCEEKKMCRKKNRSEFVEGFFLLQNIVQKKKKKNLVKLCLSE